jgi:hypothetical protein
MPAGLTKDIRATRRQEGRGVGLAAEIYHLREPQKIPLVMSQNETRRLLAVASSLKVRVLLSLGYGWRLRRDDRRLALERAKRSPATFQCHGDTGLRT